MAILYLVSLKMRVRDLLKRRILRREHEMFTSNGSPVSLDRLFSSLSRKDFMLSTKRLLLLF